MKKSHAVLIIAESLIEPHHPDDPIKEAESILNRLIKAGMLPPTYIGLMANGKKYNRETDFARDLHDFRGVWEPEDET